MVKPLIRAAFVIVRRCQIGGRCDARKIEVGGERDGGSEVAQGCGGRHFVEYIIATA